MQHTIYYYEHNKTYINSLKCNKNTTLANKLHWKLIAWTYFLCNLTVSVSDKTAPAPGHDRQPLVRKQLELKNNKERLKILGVGPGRGGGNTRSLFLNDPIQIAHSHACFPNGRQPVFRLKTSQSELICDFEWSTHGPGQGTSRLL